jgi:hypothetical protein
MAVQNGARCWLGRRGAYYSIGASAVRTLSVSSIVNASVRTCSHGEAARGAPLRAPSAPPGGSTARPARSAVRPPGISAKRVSLPQQLLPTDSDSLFSIHKMNWEEGIGNSKAVLMSTSTMDTDAAARCAFCGKRLPIVNGELRPWRASSGQFFCNEFCADDAEEVRFRRHGRADRKAHERDFFF